MLSASQLLTYSLDEYRNASHSRVRNGSEYSKDTYYAQNYASIICQGLVTSIAVAIEYVSP